MAMRFCLFAVFFMTLNSVVAMASPMEFELVSNGGNCNGCEWIAAQGDIVADTPNKLRAALSNNPDTRSVVFHSPGGNLHAALKMGRLLRDHRVSTSIGKTQKNGRWYEFDGGYCLSACALVFLGGTDRFMEDEQLGFHQFYESAALDFPDAKQFDAYDRIADQYLTGVIVNYIVEMGIDISLYKIISNTPPDQMYFLSELEAGLMGIVANSVSGSWKLLAFANGLVAETKQGGGSPKKLRFYCAGKKTHLTFLINDSPFKPNHNIFQGLKESFSQTAPALGTIQGTPYNTQYEGAYSNKSDTAIAIVFSMPASSRETFINNGNVANINTGYARFEAGYYELLSFDQIPGDKRLLRAAMKNCI